MGKTERRVTGFFLAFFILALGVASVVLLYYAGQNAIEAFWGDDALYQDEQGRIHHHDVTDEWYGQMVLRGWAFGLMYVVPGLTGLMATLFYTKAMMIQHFVIAILALILGSVLHTTGGAALILYRVLRLDGVARYDPWLGDCIYINDNALIGETYEDQQCLKGRKAFIMAIAALSTLFLGWLFVLVHLLYCAFTFSSVIVVIMHFRCISCPEKFDTFKESINHLIEYHTSDETTFQKCDDASSKRKEANKITITETKSVNRSAYSQLEEDAPAVCCTCGNRPRYTAHPPRRRGKRVAPPIPPQITTTQAQTTPQTEATSIQYQNTSAYMSVQPSTSNGEGNVQSTQSVYPMQELHAANATYGVDNQPTNVFSTFPPSTQPTAPIIATPQYTTASATDSNVNKVEVYNPQAIYPDHELQGAEAYPYDGDVVQQDYDHQDHAESPEVTTRDIDVDVQGHEVTDNSEGVGQEGAYSGEDGRGFVNAGFVQA